MSEMVDRVARAVHENRVGARTPWEQCSSTWQDELRRDARAAILAMREPTEGMLGIKHNLGVGDSGIVYLERGELVDIWQAMIDEALR